MINILLTLVLSISQAEEKFQCIFKETGDLPKIKFRGETREETMYKVAKLCLSLRTQQFTAFRSKPPSTERMIMFMEDCVNNTYCIEKVGNE